MRCLERILRRWAFGETVAPAMDRWENAFKDGDVLTIKRRNKDCLEVTWNGKPMCTYEAIVQFFLEDGSKRPHDNAEDKTNRG